MGNFERFVVEVSRSYISSGDGVTFDGWRGRNVGPLMKGRTAWLSASAVPDIVLGSKSFAPTTADTTTGDLGEDASNAARLRAPAAHEAHIFAHTRQVIKLTK